MTIRASEYFCCFLRWSLAMVVSKAYLKCYPGLSQVDTANLKPYQVLQQCSFFLQCAFLGIYPHRASFTSKVSVTKLLSLHRPCTQTLCRASGTSAAAGGAPCVTCSAAGAKVHGSRGQQEAELLQWCSGQEQCRHHVRGGESTAQQRGHPGHTGSPSSTSPV